MLYLCLLIQAITAAILKIELATLSLVMQLCAVAVWHYIKFIVKGAHNYEQNY